MKTQILMAFLATGIAASTVNAKEASQKVSLLSFGLFRKILEFSTFHRKYSLNLIVGF